MEHRQTLKNSMYEASVRVPLIVVPPMRLAKWRIRNITVRSLVSLVDIYPTLLDMAGASTLPYLAGQSLLPLIARSLSQVGRGHRRKDFITSQYHSTFAPTGIFMIRSGAFKLVTYGSPPNGTDPFMPQLFNIDKDPAELINLAETSKGKSVVLILERKMAGEFNASSIDNEAQAYHRSMYRSYFWKKDFAKEGRCIGALSEHYYVGFDRHDAARIEQWSGLPCR